MHKTAITALVFILLVGTTACGMGGGISDYQNAFLDGVAHMNRQKPEAALNDFDRAIAIDPRRFDAHVGRANALNMLGRYTEAVAAYDVALARDNRIANAYVNRAIAHSHLGNYRQAIADYEHGLALDPKIDDPPGIMQRLFSNVPNTDKGIRKHLEYLRSIVDQQPPASEGGASADTTAAG